MNRKTFGKATLLAVAIMFFVGLLSFSQKNVSVAHADPPGNNGIVKIDGVEFDDHPNNEPHPGCIFQIDFYNFDEGDLWADVSFEAVAPTNGGFLRGAHLFIGFDPAGGGHQDPDGSHTFDLSSQLANIEPHPQQGHHVRLTVHADGSIGADTKYKVFWLQCEPLNPGVCENVSSEIDHTTMTVTGTGIGTGIEWQVVKVSDGTVMDSGTAMPADFDFVGAYDVQYQLQYLGEDGEWSTVDCKFSFEDLPVPGVCDSNDASINHDTMLITGSANGQGTAWRVVRLSDNNIMDNGDGNSANYSFTGAYAVNYQVQFLGEDGEWSTVDCKFSFEDLPVPGVCDSNDASINHDTMLITGSANGQGTAWRVVRLSDNNIMDNGDGNSANYSFTGAYAVNYQVQFLGEDGEWSTVDCKFSFEDLPVPGVCDSNDASINHDTMLITGSANGQGTAWRVVRLSDNNIMDNGDGNSANYSFTGAYAVNYQVQFLGEDGEWSTVDCKFSFEDLPVPGVCDSNDASINHDTMLITGSANGQGTAWRVVRLSDNNIMDNGDGNSANYSFTGAYAVNYQVQFLGEDGEWSTVDCKFSFEDLPVPGVCDSNDASINHDTMLITGSANGQGTAWRVVRLSDNNIMDNGDGNSANYSFTGAYAVNYQVQFLGEDGEWSTVDCKFSFESKPPREKGGLHFDKLIYTSCGSVVNTYQRYLAGKFGWKGQWLAQNHYLGELLLVDYSPFSYNCSDYGGPEAVIGIWAPYFTGQFASPDGLARYQVYGTTGRTGEAGSVFYDQAGAEFGVVPAQGEFQDVFVKIPGYGDITVENPWNLTEWSLRPKVLGCPPVPALPANSDGDWWLSSPCGTFINREAQEFEEDKEIPTLFAAYGANATMAYDMFENQGHPIVGTLNVFGRSLSVQSLTNRQTSDWDKAGEHLHNGVPIVLAHVDDSKGTYRPGADFYGLRDGDNVNYKGEDYSVTGTATVNQGTDWATRLNSINSLVDKTGASLVLATCSGWNGAQYTSFHVVILATN